MMEGEQQNMFLLPQLEQLRSQHRPAEQIKGLLRFEPLRRLDSLLLGRISLATPIIYSHIEPQHGIDHLHRLSFDLAKMGAEALVSLHDGLQNTLQRSHVQPSSQPQAYWDVVFFASTFQSIDEKQPLLRE